MFAVKGRHIPAWDKRETNVWMDASLTSSDPRQHPTQKPIGVIGHCIMNSSDPGSTILDPFVGSGTTLVAARLLGYDAIGIDIESKYVDIAKKRLEELE